MPKVGKDEQQKEKVEVAEKEFAFEVNDSVLIAGKVPGRVKWRRIDQGGKRGYLIASEGAPDTWMEEGQFEAGKE